MGKSEDSTSKLVDQLRVDKDPAIRSFAAFRLARRRDGASREALRHALTDADQEVRGVAAQSLALRGSVEDLPEIIKLLPDQIGGTASPVVWAVASLAAVADEDLRRRTHAELRQLGDRAGVRVLKQIDLLLGAPKNQST
jgi:hypothetical protein